MSSQSGFSHEDVVRILKIIDTTTDIDLSIEVEGLSLRVQKGRVHSGQNETSSSNSFSNTTSTAAESALSTSVIDSIQEGIPTESTETVIGEPNIIPEELGEGMLYIYAPMTGRFFRASSPLEPVYVEVGDRVVAEDPVCLLEIMKVYNTISAEVTGVIKKILVENGEMVEQDQPLFLIELEK